ncbi:MAG: thermonuclease family protein [Desulfobacterales bacterium]
MKKYGRHVYLILLSILLIGAAPAKQKWIRVKWVIDGDTIMLDDGRHVRYIGINAPEIAHDEHYVGSKRNREVRKAEPFGDAAKKYNQYLVGSKKVRLEFDKEMHDRYGRWLAYVYLSNNTFVNKSMIEKGYAYVLTLKPNVEYEQILLRSQRDAMSKKIGIWGHWKEKEGVYTGNKQSKRFHLKTCPYGKKVEKRNRIFFKRKWDAFWSGFAPCKRCLAD